MLPLFKLVFLSDAWQSKQGYVWLCSLLLELFPPIRLSCPILTGEQVPNFTANKRALAGWYSWEPHTFLKRNRGGGLMDSWRAQGGKGGIGRTGGKGNLSGCKKKTKTNRQTNTTIKTNFSVTLNGIVLIIVLKYLPEPQRIQTSISTGHICR